MTNNYELKNALIFILLIQLFARNDSIFTEVNRSHITAKTNVFLYANKFENLIQDRDKSSVLIFFNVLSSAKIYIVVGGRSTLLQYSIV